MTNVSDNGFGISLNQSSNSIVSKNNVLNNINYNVYDIAGSNSWSFNHYGDYTGSDSNTDDIGDNTYYIAGDTGAVDISPIMQPWGMSTIIGDGASFVLDTNEVIMLHEDYLLKLISIADDTATFDFWNNNSIEIVDRIEVDRGDLITYNKTIGGSNILIFQGSLNNISVGTSSVNITNFYQFSEARDAILIDDSSDLPYPAPTISLSSPPSASVSDTVGNSRTFIATIDYIANVTWILDGVTLYTNISITTASYHNISAQAGVHNLTVVAENTNGTDQKKWTWTVDALLAPTISLSSPSSASVSDTAGNSRIFTATIDQIANVTWILDGVILHTNTSITTASYHNSSAQAGVHNLTVVAENQNGMNQTKWTWIVDALPAPIISLSSPSSASVSNTVGNSRTFTATIDQIANVAWILDGATLYTNTSVTTASYHNSSAQAGVHNLTVIAENANGTDQNKWTWSVAAPSDISTTISPMTLGQTVVLSPDDIRINIVEINPFYVKINATSTTDPTGSIRTIGTGDTGDFLNPIQTPSGTIKRIDVVTYGDSTALTIYSNFDLTIVDYLDAPVPETPTAPSITSYSPFTSSVSDSTGNSRTFAVTIDQMANLAWILDGIPLYTNTSATTASYHNSSAQAGVHNVTVVAENTNGTGQKEWGWTVTTPNTYIMTLLKGWNLVSIPITPDTPDTTSVFGSNSDVILPIYEWNTAGRQYYDASTIETGKGYWILALNDTQVVITGTL